MFQHVFATMNEMLDEIITHYPQAEGTLKEDLNQKLTLLKSMSDGIVEEWLRFEEKMGVLREGNTAEAAATEALPECATDAFQRGQGYFKLAMYSLAAQSFEQVVQQFPDSIISRMYLAMAYLQLHELNDAYGHFQFIVPLTKNNKLKAISYNALGCIQAEHHNLEMAEEYFKLAHKEDPTFQEPLANLKICESNHGVFQYGSELSSLM